MLEKALKGSYKYWTLIFVLLLFLMAGFLAYLKQYSEGLQITGLSRTVPWGFYIAQLTFLVGVAASAVMVVLPYYLHNYKAFGKITIFGEFLAIPAVIMCMLFVFVDMGQPMRVFNVALYPTLNSPMFWDFLSLSGYMFLNGLIAWVVFGAERKGVKPPRWIKPIIILSIPWAVSIHTVTAFLYSGLEARPFWMTAILAPRFLASAFAAGPSLLIILILIVKKFTTFDPGKEAVQKLGQIVTYAMSMNIFFILLELFTVLFSDMPEHVHHFQFLYFGYGGNTTLVPWMWTSAVLGVGALVLLFFPQIRKIEGILAVLCGCVFMSLWIDKGLGMIIAGFTPSPTGKVETYIPTCYELVISLGIYGLGFLILTVLYKIAIGVREET